jgi:TRAP-type mannitol/chloroaromatic compound transport system permease small subunit
MSTDDTGNSRASELRPLDRLLGLTTAGASILVLPVSLLLFLQWPLRDLGIGYSREANDLAQTLFALYVAVAITNATRRHSHLAADAFALRYPPKVRRLLMRVASLVVLAPWSLFILYASWPMVIQSVRQLESFPETYDPGYFVVKLAIMLLALLVLLQAILDVIRHGETAPP